MEYRSDFLERLRSCLEGAEDCHAVERCFREKVADEEVEDAKALVWAFAYMLVGRRREEPRERSGVFAPQWEMGGQTFPPPFEELPEEVMPLLALYAPELDSDPLAASRLHDLLWVAREGEAPVDHARRAADAYLQRSAEPGPAEDFRAMDLVDGLSRALEIAGEIGDEERIAQAVSRAIEVIEAEIANDSERRPGIPMNLLEDLGALAPARRPQALRELIASTGERYGEDPWIAQSVAELLASLADPEERRELARENVERWRVEAGKGDGLLRFVHLQHALELANRDGLAKEAQEIFAELQSISAEELDLKPISAEIEIPRDKIDPYIESFAQAEDWRAALERFGDAGPPIKAEPPELPPDAGVISRLVPTQVIGPYSSLVFGAETPADHDRIETSKHEGMQIQLWGHFAAEILEKIFGAFGAPERSQLIEFFTTDVIEPQIAKRIADCLLRFQSDDDDAALHILLPQLEAAIRSAARQVGVTVIKNPRGEAPGGVRPLGALLSALKGTIDESWRRYMLNALTDSLGVNLRDEVSHGLYGETPRADVAIALHIACQLRLWRVVETNKDPN